MITLLRLRNLLISALLAAALVAFAACGNDTETVENTGANETIDEPAAPVAEVSNLSQAPEFTLPAVNRDGTEISLSQFQGDKPVVLVFYRAYW